MTPTIVTVPNYVRPAYAYAQPYTVPVTNQSDQTTQQVINSASAPINPAAAAGHTDPATSTGLPQTIQMPAGTTIQYNTMPVTIKQNVPQRYVPTTAISIPRTVTGSLATSTLSTLSTGTPPLLSPGPPTLSPQISSTARNMTPSTPTLSPQVSTSSRTHPSVIKQITKPDNGPPLLTPPVRKADSSHLEPVAPHTQPLLPLQGTDRGSTPLHSTASQTLPAQAPALRTTPVYTQSNQYPNMYPAPLQVDPYLPPLHQQQYQPSPYHQPSPQGSYHSPQGYAGVSPHALTSPHNQMVSSHANPMGSPHHPISSPHHNAMTSPHHGNPMASPHHSGHMTSPHYSPQMSQPMMSPQYSTGYGQTYPGSPVQYGSSGYPSQAAPTIQHSPLTPSSSQYRNLGREQDRNLGKNQDKPPTPAEDKKERLPPSSQTQVKEESHSPTRQEYIFI